MCAQSVFREASFYCTQIPKYCFETARHRTLDYTKGVFMRKDHLVGLGPDTTGFEISHRTSKFEFTYKFNESHKLSIKRKHRNTEILWFLHGPYLFESSTKPLKFHRATGAIFGAIYEPPEENSLLMITILSDSIRVYGFRCGTSSEEGQMYCLFNTAKSTESTWEVCSVTPKKFYHIESSSVNYSGENFVPGRKTELEFEIMIFDEVLLVRLVRWALKITSSDTVVASWNRANHFFYQYTMIKSADFRSYIEPTRSSEQ
eukprot:TRINITY_DN5690_c0_g1_i7.p1 TRINITY_DN5690_c0_g1~~TRINITY_DN5690_c0_g1_i7.p1  ORF type:complete len:260 (-),score=31.65 TRINITY_DN5690_c0_g1_i7:77-856(-)